MKVFKFVLTVMLPVLGLVLLCGSCASSTPCNNDSCYERRVSSVDPFQEGEVAAWGTEKQQKEREEEQERRAYQPRREFRP